MRRGKTSYSLFVCSVLASAIGNYSAAQAAQYVVNDLGPGQARAMNDDGKVVGWNYDAGWNYAGACIWNSGFGVTQIGGASYIANDINSFGTVVGNYYPVDNDNYDGHAFTWDPLSGNIQFPYSLIGHSSANGINDFGETVGAIGQQAYGPFGVWPNYGAAMLKINTLGQVAGTYEGHAALF
jgi:uncharacterized membrane protein